MHLEQLDHVNIRTANLDAMVDWYTSVLGMKNGPRPAFGFPGAWLYIGDQAAVHLIGVSNEPRAIEPKLEHFAISAKGLATFIERLEGAGVAYETSHVPGFRVLQVNVFDSDGNHIHIDFSSEEAEALGL